MISLDDKQKEYVSALLGTSLGATIGGAGVHGAAVQLDRARGGGDPHLREGFEKLYDLKSDLRKGLLKRQGIGRLGTSAVELDRLMYKFPGRMKLLGALLGASTLGPAAYLGYKQYTK